MTPSEYLESFVEGNLADCLDDPACLRRAFNAAVSTAHLADHYYAYCERHDPQAIAAFRNLGAFIEHLSAETSGAFRDIRSISNVYKHLYTSPRYRAHATVLSGGALESVRLSEPAGEVEELLSAHEKGPSEDDPRWFVQFRRKDGTVGEVLPTLELFLDYWYKTFAFGPE